MAGTIPGPYAYPIIGNLLGLKNEDGAVKALENLADIHGPVFQVSMGGRQQIFLASAELLLQFTDEKQWIKTPPPALDGQSGPRGLFTARGDDPDWGQAHRILMPAFGPLKVETMFDGMKDIASQLCLKWARKDPEEPLLLTEDFTRLTLDTIALCSMDYRFNSFYSDRMHPFVEAMMGSLSYSGKKNGRPMIYNKLFGAADQKKFAEDNATMSRIANEIILKRRSSGEVKDDLLNCMLTGRDPKSGQTMRDELIASNMITFLIAGHETTSGLLSFAFLYLIQNPSTYLKAQKEVDDVFGGGPIEVRSVKDLKYLNGVLRETLRLTPTAPALSKIRNPDHKGERFPVLNGEYDIDSHQLVRILLGKCMQDTTYFGEDAREFNPDRMVDTNPNFDHYMKAWKPFGNGTRSCIGQHFAWQEALLVTALILQNFDMNLLDPSYTLHIKQALTIKPKDLQVKIRLRKGVTPALLDQRLHGSSALNRLGESSFNSSSNPETEKAVREDVSIFYGSNAGTCQSLAQRLSSAMAEKGVSAVIKDMDAGVDDLPNHPSIFITSSYEGQPPDNAARFVQWLEDDKAESAKETPYAVFGCGHKDWHETFHRIPKLVDRLMAEQGAHRLMPLGTSDVSQGTVLDDFEIWQDNLLQLDVFESLSSSSAKPQHRSEDYAEIHTHKRASQLSTGLAVAKVNSAYNLTYPGQPEKKHMELELPEGSTYECGDYLAVLPVNPDSLVKKIMAHWQFPADATITLKSRAFAPIPPDTTVSVYDLLKGYYELSQPASRKDIKTARQYTQGQSTLEWLDSLLANSTTFTSEIIEKRTSFFDLLSFHISISIPFPVFLLNLLPLRVRQYSISSSPLLHCHSDAPTCTITYSVVKGSDSFEGAASTYLSRLSPGDHLQCAVKRTSTASKPCPFRLPTDVQTPILMFCAGTGLAPFRGFVQQRAVMIEMNPALKDKMGKALLFIGCRHHHDDRIYAEEMDWWEETGVVSVRYAFSQTPENDRAKGCKYVHDRVVQDAAEVRQLWKDGARVYLCGSRKVLGGVRDAAKKIFEAAHEGEGKEELEEKRISFMAAMQERAVSDVFD